MLSRAKINIACQMMLLIATAPLASGASLDSYDDWYQIELIIFKQNKQLLCVLIPFSNLSFFPSIMSFNYVKVLLIAILQ